MTSETLLCVCCHVNMWNKLGKNLQAKSSFERQTAEVFKWKLNKLATGNFHCQDKSPLFVMEKQIPKKHIFILFVYFRVWKSFLPAWLQRKNISMETRGQKVKILYFLLFFLSAWPHADGMMGLNQRNISAALRRNKTSQNLLLDSARLNVTSSAKCNLQIIALEP